MATKSNLLVRVLPAVMLVLSVCCVAAEYNTTLDVGDAAPDWGALVGTDEETYRLSDFGDKELIVVVFTCNTCPVAVDYEGRMIALQKDYNAKGVQVVAINVNTNDGNDYEAMKVRAAEKQFNFPYLYDETQQSARDFGATVTPHVFVLDKDRKVAYMGAFDDHRDESKVENHHVRTAIDQLLDGKTPQVTETRQFGCGIKYHD